MTYSVRASMSALCAAVLASFLGASVAAAEEVETLWGVHVTTDGITIQVRSGGCTAASDFRLEVDGTAVTFWRVNPDYCRAMVPDGVMLTFAWDDVGIGAEERYAVVVRNPLRFQGSGSVRTEGSAPEEAPESAPLGVEGSVCRRGERYAQMQGGEPPPEAVDCGPGLACCYPCGIPGCDWICLPECPVGIP